MKYQMREDYKNWLLNLTYSWCLDHGSYIKLMEYLYSQPFYSIYPNDRNRASDGIEMRFRFIENCEGLQYTYHDVYKYLTHDCNVLEMMTALAKRCEEHIMGDPEIGDKSAAWFWEMICSMGLQSMTDENFDILKVEKKVTNMLDHNYKKDGTGGLFTVKNPNLDMRYAEIWYQMNWYLSELYDQY